MRGGWGVGCSGWARGRGRGRGPELTSAQGWFSGLCLVDELLVSLPSSTLRPRARPEPACCWPKRAVWGFCRMAIVSSLARDRQKDDGRLWFVVENCHCPAGCWRSLQRWRRGPGDLGTS